jgi:hypothetical protein
MALSGACSADELDVGSRDAGYDGLTNPAPDDTEACRNGTQLSVVGTWRGYIENFGLNPGSDTLRLTISSATTAQACGKVTLGNKSPATPATDPAIGYPPGETIPNNSAEASARFVELAGGYPMTVREGTATSTRIRFIASWHEYWRSWCVLQKPILLDLPGALYSCAPSNATSDGTSCFTYESIDPDGAFELRPLDCGKYRLCSQAVCACDMQSCTEGRDADFTFDLRVAGDDVAGSVKIGILNSQSSEFHNVYLTRVQ